MLTYTLVLAGNVGLPELNHEFRQGGDQMAIDWSSILIARTYPSYYEAVIWRGSLPGTMRLVARIIATVSVEVVERGA